MSKKIICDRCLTIIGENMSFKHVNIYMGVGGKTDGCYKTIDLCSRCCEELDAFYHERMKDDKVHQV